MREPNRKFLPSGVKAASASPDLFQHIRYLGEDPHKAALCQSMGEPPNLSPVQSPQGEAPRPSGGQRWYYSLLCIQKALNHWKWKPPEALHQTALKH
jgi:hypothetical protein